MSFKSSILFIIPFIGVTAFLAESFRYNIDQPNAYEKEVENNPTNFKDTTYIDGNCLIILRPDSIRFSSYLENDEEWIYEVDSDFGFGISRALDSLEKEVFYSKIKHVVCQNRYVIIAQKYNEDIIIDRDTIDYGIILSSPTKEPLVDNQIYGMSYYYDLIKNYFTDTLD